MQSGHPSTPALASAAAVLTAGLVVLAVHDAGPQARHMALHILAMNVAAPAFAALVVARRPVSEIRPRVLWIATLVQIAALWVAHLPAVQGAAVAHQALQAGTHMLLLATAVAFWVAIIALSAMRPWHAVAALALSAKLFCLLAALLVFAPRTLGTHHHGHALDDQQLAGLLMIVACPLSYLIAALLVTTRSIGSADRLRPMRSAG